MLWVILLRSAKNVTDVGKPIRVIDAGKEINYREEIISQENVKILPLISSLHL